MAKAITLRDGRKIKDVCEEYNLKLSSIYVYKSNHPDLDYDKIISLYIAKDKSFNEKCKIAGVDSTRAYGIKKRYKNWTDEQIINHCKNLDGTVSIREACRIKGISYNDNILAFAKQFKDKTSIEIVDIWVDKLDKDKQSKDYLRKTLESNEISTSTYYKVKNRFPEYTLDDIVKYVLNKRNNTKCKEDYIGEERIAVNGQKMRIIEYNSSTDITVVFEDGTIVKARYNNFTKGKIKNPNLDKTLKIRDMCKILNLDYNVIYAYKRIHPELTDEQIIMHYRPDCYINWLGELVIPT